MGKQVCLSRRAVVGGALAIGASALAGSSAAGTLAERAWAQDAGESGGNAADKGAQYGFLIKARNCVDCGECVKACRLWSRTPASAEARRKVVPYVTKSGKEAYLSTSCMHCETPSCAAVCPAGAITKGDGGVVTVNKERCIGCKYCYQACPYGVPHYTASGMDKCDCCLGAGVPLGEKPHCVSACKLGALSYGKIDDLMAQTNGKARRIDGPTGPSYLLV